ncbi:hypothetical protein NPIL_561141 [Nephila pilipes]|uniref:Uncharacterized protein n=1 Tax=Nephila pilipes TaxID=299642 RepID=A0A8X6QYD6_NEPPI|nr:hypothetical protein NPIL_561141 [Nephila pilipes]
MGAFARVRSLRSRTFQNVDEENRNLVSRDCVERPCALPLCPRESKRAVVDSDGLLVFFVRNLVLYLVVKLSETLSRYVCRLFFISHSSVFLSRSENKA